jgi:HPt (histidine-containing phosphotransfer) domain-containing protein
MDDYVSKPVKSDALLTVLRKWAQPPRSPDRFTTSFCAEAGTLANSTDPAPPPALDAAAFAALKELYRDEAPQALFEVLAQFLQDTSVRMAILRATAAADDALGLARAAHGLKSSSASVEALGMAALCQQLEQLGQAGISCVALQLVDQLASEFLRVQQTLER